MTKKRRLLLFFVFYMLKMYNRNIFVDGGVYPL